MSDSRIYELEDIVWDDFSIGDDHLVPYPQIQQNEAVALQTETHKKLKHEAGITSSTGSREAERVAVGTEKTLFSSPKITSDKVLANGSWSHNPDTGQTYSDVMGNLSSEGLTVTRGDFISNNNFYVGASNPINNCTAADDNILYSLSDTLQSESELSFLCNGHENKEIDDSLFYDWPEIGDYDLNQMLRSCDSAYGLGDLAKEDAMCWFSSPTAVDGPDSASQSQVRSSYSDSNSLKIFSENVESPQPTYESPTVDALKKRSAGASYNSSTPASNTTGQSCLSKASSTNELVTNSYKMDREKPHKKVVDVIYSDPVSAQNVIFKSENEESPNKNSQSDEHHPHEEISFLQLQEVMDQMDLKTKLCIRDSLYRLARSAEQRHGTATMYSAGKADKKSSEPMIAGTKQAGLIDIETDTNPIDRSIAHLLFHRPSDSSKILLSSTPPGHNLNDGAEDSCRHDVFKDANIHVAKKEE